jgi:peptidoglycan/xylan/chitin deacetylase (PgdA/CDA1 family)
MVNAVKRLALSASALLGTQRLFLGRNKPVVAALLFHDFFFPGQSHQDSIEQLRRELDFLCTRYTPISLPQLVAGLNGASLPDRAVLVTSDDVGTDVLDVADEFKAFGVPLSVFVCVGWTAVASAGIAEDLVARAASSIQWYEGNDIEIPFGRNRMALCSDSKARNIETVIAEQDALRPYLEELCVRIEEPLERRPRNSPCTWDELRHLASMGVGIGAHSVTHVPLSQASTVRQRFEIAESKRLCEVLLGRCEAFAYPYGTADTFSAATKAELQSAGYLAAFLSHSDFIAPTSDSLALPRITMPDEPMTIAEFRARSSGAGILSSRLKMLLRNGLGREADSGTQSRQ